VPRPRTILAFDFGLRRIGVAVGQDVTATASPLGIVANDRQGVDHDAIALLLKEWRPAALVVGLPMHVDGSAGDLQKPVDCFIAELARYQLPVATVDERYTSIEAEQSLKNVRKAGRRGQVSKAMIDSAAAVIIAERYLSSR